MLITLFKKNLTYLWYVKIQKNKHTKGMYNGIFNTISRVWYFLKYQYLKFI